MRWSQAYRARIGHHDTIDTMDTMGAKAPETAQSVHSVKSVIVAKAGETASPPFVTDRVERAAIQAEAIPVRRIRKRPVSWARADDEPASGDYCGCCSGSLFWSDTDPPRGWCCTTCHPPCHLQADLFRVVAT